jgi:hypothetical protein
MEVFYVIASRMYIAAHCDGLSSRVDLPRETNAAVFQVNIVGMKGDLPRVKWSWRELQTSFWNAMFRLLLHLA